MILALDPGPVETAWLELMPNGAIGRFAKQPNDQVASHLCQDYGPATRVVIEMIASYGMPVGAEIFETCVFIGRLVEIAEGNVASVYRMKRIEVKTHLCHSAKAKDSNVRQALIDRFGPGKEKAVGRVASPGPLFGIKADCWAALALAVTYADLFPQRPQQTLHRQPRKPQASKPAQPALT